MSLITCDVPECTSCDARQNDSFCGELAPLGLRLAGYCLVEKCLCLFLVFWTRVWNDRVLVLQPSVQYDRVHERLMLLMADSSVAVGI